MGDQSLGKVGCLHGRATWMESDPEQQRGSYLLIDDLEQVVRQSIEADINFDVILHGIVRT